MTDIIVDECYLDRLQFRQMALIELGMIRSPEDLPDFAQNLSVNRFRCCVHCTDKNPAPVNQGKSRMIFLPISMHILGRV